MRRLLFALPALALSLTGCAQIQKATDYLASPSFTAASSNVRNVAVAFDCGIVAPGAQLTEAIAVAVNAGDAFVATTARVYAVSSIVCSAIGGTPSRLPPGTVVPVAR